MKSSFLLSKQQMFNWKSSYNMCNRTCNPFISELNFSFFFNICIFKRLKRSPFVFQLLYILWFGWEAVYSKWQTKPERNTSRENLSMTQRNFWEIRANEENKIENKDFKLTINRVRKSTLLRYWVSLSLVWTDFK